jgi:hypothetical protein
MESCMFNMKCRPLLSVIVVFISFISSGCSDSAGTSNPSSVASEQKVDLPSYEIIKNDSFSEPGVTKVIWSIVLPKTVTKQSLTALLNSLYEKEKEDHSNAATICIYAYSDRDYEEEGLGRWLAWLMTNDGIDKLPTIQFHDEQLAELSIVPEVRFGQTEDNRKLIYKDIYSIKDDYPSDIKAQNREMKYTANSLHLTRKQLDAIYIEGGQKDWAMPIPPPSNR